MTEQELDRVEAYFGPYAKMPAWEPAMRLLEHARELREFVVYLTDHLALPGPSPEKTAEHYQMVRKANVLRQKIQPVKALAK